MDTIHIFRNHEYIYTFQTLNFSHILSFCVLSTMKKHNWKIYVEKEQKMRTWIDFKIGVWYRIARKLSNTTKQL